jgi:ribosomal protein L32
LIIFDIIEIHTVLLKELKVKVLVKCFCLFPDDSGSVQLIMIYSAISSTLLVVTLLSFIAYYIHRKKVSKEKRTKNQSQTIHYRTNTRTCSVDNLFQESTLENQRVCHYCGHSPRPENLAENSVGPPSYRTYGKIVCIFSLNKSVQYLMKFCTR